MHEKLIELGRILGKKIAQNKLKEIIGTPKSKMLKISCANAIKSSAEPTHFKMKSVDLGVDYFSLKLYKYIIRKSALFISFLLSKPISR